MMGPFVRAGLLSALCAAPAVAQIAGSTYGSSGLYATAVDPNLQIRLDANADRASAALELSGGSAGEAALLALSAAPASLPLGCCATILVADPLFAIPGTFEPDGTFTVRFPAQQPALAGQSIYAQGVHVVGGGGLSLSQGLQMTFGKVIDPAR